MVESDRPAIFKHISERFGSNYVAKVASYGTIQSKGVIDEVGRHLAKQWDKTHTASSSENPYSLKKIEKIKREFDEDEQKCRHKHPEIFYYYDGLLDTRVSQSVHPAGVVISPITLNDNYGIFLKEGEWCLLFDMEEVHDGCGLAKYDFLALKTVQVIRDTCNYLGIPYPRSHEINWNDKKVWADILRNSGAVFQFEGKFAFDCLKKYKPQNLFDMSLVTACIRPSGASYRNDLLAHKFHRNPSPIIDELLKDNRGFLVYQEDTIKFLQQICGLSGSEADNIRRAIGRKQKDRLDKAMPDILNGYCLKSSQPREIAEREAKEFIQIIDDSADYQFGYNHSIAYCMLGYYCAYFRYYHPIEFITAFLNNAANDEDTRTGANLARIYGVRVILPKFGYSKGDYFYNKEKNVIAKGVGSVKYLSVSVADELYEASQKCVYTHFVDVLCDITQNTSVDARQIEVLLKIDFFSRFGNQRELLRIYDIFEMFNKGTSKLIKKGSVADPTIESIIRKYSTDRTKNGEEAKSYKLFDVRAIMRECEDLIKAANIPDLSDIVKLKNFEESMGYTGYASGKEADRPKLYIKDVYPLFRKKDGVQFGYSVITHSIGSGIESRFTVLNRVYDVDPILKDDIIRCKGYQKDGVYFTLTAYEHLYE